MQQRERFLGDHRRALLSMTELCARYGISRKTGYKWLKRYEEGGRPALADRSHTPLHCPHRIDPAMEALLCAARRAHPTWGPIKLLQWLRRRHDEISSWPAPSTVGDLLARHGLVPKRRRRRPIVHPGVVPLHTTEANDLWTADFKGQFRTQDGIYCFPLTVADPHTRFLIACHGLLSIRTVGVRPIFERAFRTYGLPAAIRTDNGVPFATTGIHGLSQLNVWWMRLGIQHQRIRPASPQENGAHERMHKTLKAETLRPPKRNLPAQQQAFDAFRSEFNQERPHQAHDGDPPATHYAPSRREYPDRLPAIEYPGHYIIKRVTNAGTFRLKHKLLFISNALKQQFIGLEEIDDGIWSIYFNTVLLAQIDEREMRIHG
jgi:transposase InsO family protein